MEPSIDYGGKDLWNRWVFKSGVKGWGSDHSDSEQGKN